LNKRAGSRRVRTNAMLDLAPLMRPQEALAGSSLQLWEASWPYRIAHDGSAPAA